MKGLLLRATGVQVGWRPSERMDPHLFLQDINSPDHLTFPLLFGTFLGWVLRWAKGTWLEHPQLRPGINYDNFP